MLCISHGGHLGVLNMAFESFGLLVMTDTLYMWSVWTLLVTFKTLDNGAQVKGSLTFVVA